MLGIDPNLPPEEKKAFDMLDNDYFRIAVYERDSETTSQEGSGGKPNVLRNDPDFELVSCSEEFYHDLVVSTVRIYFPKGICFKYRDKVAFKGNYGLESFKNKYFSI